MTEWKLSAPPTHIDSRVLELRLSLCLTLPAFLAQRSESHTHTAALLLKSLEGRWARMHQSGPCLMH